MAEGSTPSTGGSPQTEQVAPAEYAKFIDQIELVDIWLRSATITNDQGPDSPSDASLALRNHAEYELSDGDFEGFDVAQTYEARFEKGERLLASVDVTFGLRFRSKQPMTDTIFRLFNEVNLPVNTWPYFREFLSATLGRMGWMPFTLPAIKRGTRRATRQRRSKPAQS